MRNSSKLAILQSLDAMDHVQMEEVLTYIKGLLNQPRKTLTHRAEAMKEIRQALRRNSNGLPITA